MILKFGKKIEIEIRKTHEYNVNVNIQLKNNSIASVSNDKKNSNLGFI